MNYKTLPKIDLHCHLDGSLRATTVLDIIKKDKLDYNFTLKEVKEALTVPITCTSLVDYLKCFSLPIAAMQTKENLERVSFELMEDCAKENIKYLEIRFAPQQHKIKGLTTKEIIESVIKGMRKGEEKYDIKGNYILSCMKHLSSESALEIIEEGKEYLGKGVVAVDLCGAEDRGFAHKFIVPMKKAKEYGYKITIHAGETGIGQNVEDAITLLGADRIGHGLFITNSKSAYDMVKNKNIPLELCPTSNLQTKAVDKYISHPIYSFLNDEIMVTLNTDNRTVSNTNMSKEHTVLKNAFDISINDYKKIYLNSIKAAFISKEEKNRLKKKLIFKFF